MNHKSIAQKNFFKTFGLLCFVWFSFNLNAQSDSSFIKFPKNEIRANLLYTVIGLPELTYERALTKHTAIGASFFYGVTKNVNVGFGLFPFYRLYFGEKHPVKGFFVEANSALYSIKQINYSPVGLPTTQMNLQAGVGFAIGGKFVVQDVYTCEILGGLGRNFIDNSNVSGTDIYPRFGISLGHKF